MKKPNEDIAAFKEALEAEHKFPTTYVFKFIVPRQQEQAFLDLFPAEKFQKKESSTGRFSSFTLRRILQSSDEVIHIYQRAYEIEGIISL